MAPSLVAGTLTALDTVLQSQDGRARLQANAAHFRRRMNDEGFELLGSDLGAFVQAAGSCAA
jgi:glycine C-acetyltransferase